MRTIPWCKLDEAISVGNAPLKFANGTKKPGKGKSKVLSTYPDTPPHSKHTWHMTYPPPFRTFLELSPEVSEVIFPEIQALGLLTREKERRNQSYGIVCVVLNLFTCARFLEHVRVRDILIFDYPLLVSPHFVCLFFCIFDPLGPDWSFGVGVTVTVVDYFGKAILIQISYGFSKSGKLLCDLPARALFVSAPLLEKKFETGFPLKFLCVKL